jgi:hypothetical protein
MARDNDPQAPLKSRRMYIEHLAQAIQAKESGRIALCPTAYRLCAKRLRKATAGFPEAELFQTLGISHSAVADVLEDRFFETTGRLPGPGAKAVKAQADGLLSRMRGATAAN